MVRFLMLIFLGMDLGFIAATWIAPKLLRWWFTPPISGGIDCSPSVNWGMNRLVMIQIASGILFAVAVAILGHLFWPSQKKITSSTDSSLTDET